MLKNTQELLVIILMVLTKNLFYLSIVPSTLLTLGPKRIGRLGNNHYGYLGEDKRMLAITSISLIIYIITRLLINLYDIT